jgi:hypothetical protein
MIKVALATDEVLKKYNSFDEFVDENTHEIQKIVFSTTVPVRNFKYSAIELDLEHEPTRIIEHYHAVKHQIDELSPEHSFVVNWMEIGSMPHAGISFHVENGPRRYFAIVGNNADPEEGSSSPVLLVEYPGEAFERYAGTTTLNMEFNNEKILSLVHLTAYDAKENYLVFDSLVFEYHGKEHTLPLSGSQTGLHLQSSPFDYDEILNSWFWITDFNFDGYMDIAIENNMAGGTNDIRRFVYLYNPSTQSFYHHEELSEMSNLSVDTKNQTLKQRSVGGQSIYHFLEYKWEDNQLTLISSTTQTIQNNGNTNHH